MTDLRRSARAVTLGALAPLALVTALAGAQPLAPLTLEDAVVRATTRGPAVQAAAGARAVTVGRARAGGQFNNPLVELRRENEGAPIPYDDFVTLTLPVSFTGRGFAMRDALGAARVRGVADSMAVMRDAAYGAAAAWWEAWVAEESHRVAAQQAARFAELARFDSLRAVEGAVAEAGAMRTMLEAQRAAYAAAQAAARAAQSRGELAARIGLDDASRVVLAAPLRGASAADLPEESTAVAAALEARPDVIAATAAAREADRRRAAERRNTLPDVGLSGGYKGTGGFASAQFGLLFTPPLLNANGGAREQATGEWLLAEADRRATVLRATNDVRAALTAVRALDAGTRGFDADFPARADAIATAADASYREGAATLTETLEALRALADGRAAGIRAVADRALARLALRRAIGAPVLEELP
jgi:outer membrane protein TolC